MEQKPITIVDELVVAPTDDKLSEPNSQLLLSIWSLKSRFMDLQTPLEPIHVRYAFLRDAIVSVNDAVFTNTDKTIEKETYGMSIVFQEIQNMYNVYKEYTVQLKRLQNDLQRNIQSFADNSEQTWEQTMALRNTNEDQCKKQLFHLKETISEYGCLEDAVNEEYNNALDILQLSLNYLSSLSKHEGKKETSSQE